MEFEAVIGLEVHAQLATKTKIFCSCPTTFGAEANTQVCPVCLGMPGVLPVLNRMVVEYSIRAGLALGCTINETSIFARKNYFYPDLPKGYQISQYELPICSGGGVEIEKEDGTKKFINLTRIHMEEDAGKSVHGENLGKSGASYVDLNRTGVPLIEIVSEPEMRSAEEARLYLQKLKSFLEYAEVSDCNMEEGSFRCDANVSIRPVGETKLGTKVEIKNMNSFKHIQKAIDYEIARQKKCHRDGEPIVQETRLWDVAKGVTFSMRSKEMAHDYRYFPDPDLVPVVVKEDWISRVKAELPEMPDARAARFMDQYGLPAYDAGVLTAVKAYADFFEETVKAHSNAKAAANWIMAELMRVMNEKGCEINEIGITPANLAAIIKLIDDGKINQKIARDVFADTIETGKAPADIVADKGLLQVSDEGELEAIVKQVLDANPDETERYKAGDKKLVGFFMGQIMKLSKGKANPQVVNQIISKLTS